MDGRASGVRATASAVGSRPEAVETAAGARPNATCPASGPSISVVIPTLNGGHGFRHLCRHLQLVRDRFDLEVLVIDSGSRDSTPEEAARAGFRVHRIHPVQFGHGRTRNLGVQMTSGDIICFLTQDVLPCSPDWPERFARALAEPGVAGVYGRQVPRDATTMEMFFVALNYPAHRLVYSAGARGKPADGNRAEEGIAHGGRSARGEAGDRSDGAPGRVHPRPGRVLFSNAFSAVRRDVVRRIPFQDFVPVSEDQVWAHQALSAGYTIVYEPEAEALHAHRYSIRGLFRRTYLVGRALNIVGIDGGASFGESVAFLSTELRYFIRHGHTHRLPHLLAYEFIRWLGFQAGRRFGRRRVPPAVRADLSDCGEAKV